jgi:hypothetical protein
MLDPSGKYGSLQVTLSSNIVNNQNTLTRIETQMLHMEEVRYLDIETSRCSNALRDETPTVTCIWTYIQKRLGCNIPWIRIPADNSKKQCQSHDQFQELAHLTDQMAYNSANYIYNITGCMASCKSRHYSLTTSSSLTDHNGKDNKELRSLKHVDYSYLFRCC